MTSFRKRFPLLASFLVLAVMLMGMVGVSLLVGLLYQAIPGLYDCFGDFGLQLLVELPVLLAMLGLTWLLGMGRVLTCRGRGFLRSLIPGAVLLALYLFAALENAFLCLGFPLQRPGAILAFLLCMAAVGVCEELTFRGLITGMLYDKYGRSPAGVWLSVVVSSLLFGAMHLTNAIGGEMALSGVLLQMAGAAAMGMCFAAIYLRGRNIWAVAAIHGFMDLCALVSSGIFRAESMADIIGGYTPLSLIGYGFYLVCALILLRPSKLREITASQESSPGDAIKLGLATFVFGAMVGAIIALTI